MGKLGYAKIRKPRRVATDAVAPYVPAKCKYHPKRTASVSTKLHDRPIVDLCDECYLQELTRLGMTIRPKEAASDEANTV